MRSAEEGKAEVQQYKAEATSARLEHEEAKKSFDSQVSLVDTGAVTSCIVTAPSQRLVTC